MDCKKRHLPKLKLLPVDKSSMLEFAAKRGELGLRRIIKPWSSAYSSWELLVAKLTAPLPVALDLPCNSSVDGGVCWTGPERERHRWAFFYVALFGCCIPSLPKVLSRPAILVWKKRSCCGKA
jgi:hypothetical protein